MVGVAQLVERWIVIPVVVGSIPIVHPIFFRGALMQIWRLCFKRYADVVKLVDTLDLGSSGASCKSSSLFVRTMLL